MVQSGTGRQAPPMLRRRNETCRQGVDSGGGSVQSGTTPDGTGTEDEMLNEVPCVVTADLHAHLSREPSDEAIERATEACFARFMADPAKRREADEWLHGTHDHGLHLDSALADLGAISRDALDSADARALIERIHAFGVLHARARATKLRELADEAVESGDFPLGGDDDGRERDDDDLWSGYEP